MQLVLAATMRVIEWWCWW